MSNSSNPLVSIVIPVYNGSNYLAKAIDSALKQSYSNKEIIIVNDGSNDKGATENIINSYGDKIRHFNKENGGVATALNLAIKNMQGKYFSWLSHDDIYYPNKLERQIKLINEIAGDDVILYSDYDFINANGTYIKTYKGSEISPDKFKYSLMTGHIINGCSALINKLFFDDVGLFNEDLITTQDYDMWYRLSLKYRFVHTSDVLIQSRLHEKQDTKTKFIEHMRECDEFFHACLMDISNENNRDNVFDNFQQWQAYWLKVAHGSIRGFRFKTAKRALNLFDNIKNLRQFAYFLYIKLVTKYKICKFYLLYGSYRN